MIPLELEFSGLNSYRQPQRVDFRQLTAQGLFGIFGVTGAGKSTLLDAITLALFGQVRRAPRQTQGIINAREKRCHVSFSFALGSHNYRAERLFERVKNDPFASAVKACRLLEDETLVLADKSNVMDGKIKALLNMDCDRFCQTVILPQGQFDQLLKLRPADRSGLLEELFRFGDYGEALVRRCRERLRAAEAALTAIDEKLALLGPCAPSDIAQLKQQLTLDAQQAQQLATQLEQQQQQYHSQQALEGQARELARQQQSLTQLQTRAQAMEQTRHCLQLALQAEPLRAALDEAVSLNRQANEAVRSAQTAAETEARVAQQQQAAQEKLSRATAKLDDLRQTGDEQLRRLDLAAHQRQEAEQADSQLQQARRQLQPAALQQQAQDLAARREQLRQELHQAEQGQSACHQQVTQSLLAWERAVSDEARAQSQNAAALLSQQLRPGQPCPVCGSREHYQLTHDAADVQAAAQAVSAARKLWRAAQTAEETAATQLEQLRKQENEVALQHQQCQQQLLQAQERIQSLEQAVRQQQQQWRQLGAHDDPAAAAQQLRQEMERAARAEVAARRQAEQDGAELQAARLQLQATRTTAAERTTRLSELRQQLLSQLAQSDFQEANAARLALRESQERARMQNELRAYDDSLLTLEGDVKRLQTALDGYQPQLTAQLQQEVEQLSRQQSELHNQRGRREAALERAMSDAAAADSLKRQRQQAATQADLLKRLANLLKGNAFVRYLARGAMLELAHEASDVLLSLTNRRFRLEIIDDGRGSNDFIIVDLYNGGLRRQVAGLSGGETFLVSLALALALSRKIQMHAAPLGFFFLDEGFGSLDDNSLEAALSVLEKLPSDKRAVGVITHVREVRQRVPRYLLVHADPTQGSSLEMLSN